MSIEAKICGITDEPALRAAADGGARYVGLVFCANSPRNISIDAAAKLAKLAPASITVVGLFVDPLEVEIKAVLQKVALDMIQLHGKEKTGRIRRLSRNFHLPIMKAISVRSEQDFGKVGTYEEVVDRLLFDAKPSAGKPAGGNAESFDWNLLKTRTFTKPWMLAGGLNAANLEDAVRISGATAVDVSSGVETRPGHKDPQKIREFLKIAARL